MMLELLKNHISQGSPWPGIMKTSIINNKLAIEGYDLVDILGQGGMEVGREAVHQNLQVLTGECLFEETRPLNGLLRSLQSVADTCREKGQAISEKILGERVKILAQYEQSLGEVFNASLYAEPEYLPADQAKLRLYQYLEETCERCSITISYYQNRHHYDQENNQFGTLSRFV